MSKFIEVTSANGNKLMVNCSAIQEISKNIIYFPMKGEYVVCKETYDELKNKLEEVGAI